MQIIQRQTLFLTFLFSDIISAGLNAAVLCLSCTAVQSQRAVIDTAFWLCIAAHMFQLLDIDPLLYMY